MKTRENLRSLSGPEKAAAFLLALTEEQVAAVFTQLDDEEIKEVSAEMASLGKMSSKVSEGLCQEFTELISSKGTLVGSHDSTERLLSKVLDKSRANNIMEEIRGPAGRTMWDKLNNVNETLLANYLRNEYPQTVAVVLSKVRTDHAARVLAMLPEPFALEVINRMLTMEMVQKDILTDVEKTLRVEFMNNLARTSRRDSHEMMADIFNSLDRATEARLSSALNEVNPESAEKIRALMFTFEDLKGLDSAGVQTLLRSIDKSKLIIALKGVPDAMKSLFLDNMSERAAKIMREDMEAIGPVKVKDVYEAQMEIVAIARALSDRGEIILSDGSGTEDMVY